MPQRKDPGRDGSGVALSAESSTVRGSLGMAASGDVRRAADGGVVAGDGGPT